MKGNVHFELEQFDTCFDIKSTYHIIYSDYSDDRARVSIELMWRLCTRPITIFMRDLLECSFTVFHFVDYLYGLSYITFL